MDIKDGTSKNDFFIEDIFSSNDKKEGTQISIVTTGDIYISDNLLYQNIELDAISFATIKPLDYYPDVYQNDESLGNIQFGDLNFGTTFRFGEYMFAENNFETENVNNNLFIYGNMTASGSLNISKGLDNNLPSSNSSSDFVKITPKDGNHKLFILLKK